jgi:excisionase family DNA binding protein
VNDASKETVMLNRAHGDDVAPKLLLTPEEAAEVLSLGRTTVYRLLAREALPSVKIGASRRIPFVALREYVDRVMAETGYGRTAS